MKPSNFPARKYERRVAALARFSVHPKKDDESDNDYGHYLERVNHQRKVTAERIKSANDPRGIRTKIKRGEVARGRK